MIKPIFDVHYAGGRTSLVMEADLQRGWTKLQKTFGFFRQTRIPYRDDLTVRAQMTVIAQLASFDEWASTFPDIEMEDDGFTSSCVLRKRHLVLKVPLSADQPWRKTAQGRPEIFVEQLPLLMVDPTRWFDLRAWIIFHDGTSVPVPDVRVWVKNRLTMPGGQFESNRSRH